MTARLRELLRCLQAQAGPDAEGRVYVDAGPILEREVAQRAGLGWFGKNTLLINTKRGSYFFLGEIVTNVLLEFDTPAIGGCGTCTRCLDACPTGAIFEPYKVDSRRCLSYLTIELKGDIPSEFQPALSASGNRIYGCDICQEVCPFNQRRAVPTDDPAFQPREITSTPRLMDLLLVSEEEFREKFRKSPVKRAKRRGLLRNVATALAASEDPESGRALRQAAENDPESLVREHAKGALEKIGGRRNDELSTEGEAMPMDASPSRLPIRSKSSEKDQFEDKIEESIHEEDDAWQDNEIRNQTIEDGRCILMAE